MTKTGARGPRQLIRFSLISASVGFIMAWALMAGGFKLLDGDLAGTWTIVLCPPSLASMAFENVSLARGLFGWLVISLCNAVLYGFVGMLAFGVGSGFKWLFHSIIRS